MTPSYVDPNRSHTKNSLRKSVNDLIYQNPSDNTNIFNSVNSKDLNNPVYNALIIKILEAKALDCLCTGYSKRNTQRQIAEALAKINEKLFRLSITIFFYLFNIEMTNLNRIQQVFYHHPMFHQY